MACLTFKIICIQNFLFRLKGVWLKTLDFRFFSWISLTRAPEYAMGVISNFYENSRRYSKANVNHWCQRHRWKMQNFLRFEVFSYFVEMLLGCCLHLCIVILYLMFTLRCRQVDFVANVSLPVSLFTGDKLSPMYTIPSINTKLQISPWVFVKIRNGPNRILTDQGQTDS